MVPTGLPATTAPIAPAATLTVSTARPTDMPASIDDAMTAIKKINLNTATAEEILAIPNTGNRMVREFQEYRPYTSILQFRREIGKYVDDQTVAGYEQYVFVPIVPNSSDAETLEQIPGLDVEQAAALIAARPFASDEAFLQALSQYISAQEVAVAQSYLAAP
jgi:DNA uptake protein ComE-like DNA-binding protein